MWKSLAPWLLLAAILALFLLYLAWLKPADQFGWYHDDTIYFSSAQSLAQGRGYTLPSLPGTPSQTKYPVLYPWLLSCVWRLWPAFPSNVSPAVWMTALFGCWFLIAAFQLLRKLAGLGDWPALLLVALCAFHPHFLLLSGAILSDIPFLALALAAAVVADSAMRPTARPGLVATTAVLAGLSALMRGFGLPVVAGIVAAGLFRRAYRQAALVALLAAPFLAVALLWPAASPMPAGADSPGWRQTWLFYTSYGQFWKLSVPRLDVFLAMLGFNLRSFLEAPASACLFPPPGEGESYAGVLLCVTLSVAILAGVVRQARMKEWKPIHFIFPFYAPIVLTWNYTLMDRFLLLFLPLFYAGLWIEGRHFASMLLTSFRQRGPASQKILAGVLAIGLAVLGIWGVNYYLRGARGRIRVVAARRAALAAEKGQLYDWIRRNTDPGARFIAYEDASLYLYTARQAARPIAFSTEAFYKRDEGVLGRDLTHITDTARHIRARYWVASEDDFHLETGLPMIETRMSRLKSVLPVVFRSRGGKVELLDLSCIFEPDRRECDAVRPVLFPIALPPGAP